MCGLFYKKTYEVENTKCVPAYANIIGSSFFLAIKFTETEDPTYKSLFFVQGHADRHKDMLVHNSNTIIQHSLLRFVAISAMCGYRFWSQNVT